MRERTPEEIAEIEAELKRQDGLPRNRPNPTAIANRVAVAAREHERMRRVFWQQAYLYAGDPPRREVPYSHAEMADIALAAFDRRFPAPV